AARAARRLAHVAVLARHRHPDRPPGRGHARRAGVRPPLPAARALPPLARAPRAERPLAARGGARRSRQSDLRRIRRAGLRPAIERGAAAVRGFLRDWYEPYVHARWGETCVDLADDDRRHAERDGEI